MHEQPASSHLQGVAKKCHSIRHQSKLNNKSVPTLPIKRIQAVVDMSQHVWRPRQIENLGFDN